MTCNDSMKGRRQQDMEMISKYFERKTCKKVQHIDYIDKHPQLKKLVANYVQALTVVKPVNILFFTIQYFKAFAKTLKNCISTSRKRN
ncbi:ciliogenesis-associated TTC17-interacting protein-like isoform X2 [Cephus cinctus]|nr:ciliogenesis-associated TTC17-interacting protein-like isoform X2 [Cephus cinctus]